MIRFRKYKRYRFVYKDISVDSLKLQQCVPLNQSLTSLTTLLYFMTANDYTIANIHKFSHLIFFQNDYLHLIIKKAPTLRSSNKTT